MPHVTGKPGVLAQDDLRPGAFRNRARIQPHEDVRGGAAQFQCGLGSNRLYVRYPTNAVRSEDSLGLFHVTTLLRLDLGPVGVGEKQAFLVNSESHRGVAERELSEGCGPLNHSAPVFVFAANDVSPFIVAATDWGQVKRADRAA